MKTYRMCGLAFPILLFLLCVSSQAQDMTRLLDCGANHLEMSDYMKSMSSANISPDMVSQELNRQLPSVILGENFDCLYETILKFGDDKTILHYAERSSHRYKYDRPGYAQDLLELLKSRSTVLSDVPTFHTTIEKFIHPISVLHFLRLHLRDIPLHSQMEIMAEVVERDFLPGQYGYEVSKFMEDIYKRDPRAYESFIASLKTVPYEFTCFKDDTCP